MSDNGLVGEAVAEIIKDPPTPKSMSASEARALLAVEQQERERSCTDAVKAALERYNCTFDVVTVLRAGQVQTQVNIQALPPKD